MSVTQTQCKRMLCPIGGEEVQGFSLVDTVSPLGLMS